MNFYQLRSILASNKKSFELSNPSISFAVAGPSTRAYIEPTFEKFIYDTERPPVILISAVGATGKTALAQQLSRNTRLPILDLGKHKPVGDNSLTGLLTSAFDLENISALLQALKDGSYGIIIDGIDEGRSKTTAKAFDAFLDDVVKLCKSSERTTFVILGRTQILDECWLYLTDKGIPTALITIAPFNREGARDYIDAFTEGATSPYAKHYAEVRDFIISQLSKAFVAHVGDKKEEFLSFIGYPPVLDSIVTVLTEEQNYHRLLQELHADDSKNIEVNLLRRISEYILERERTQKVLPNIIIPVLNGRPESIRESVLSAAFLPEEQSARLVAHCLGRPLTLPVFPEATLNEKYEAQLVTWLPEHPFIKGNEFRNTVFEALALATLITSTNTFFHEMVTEYLASHKHSYHLVYMLDAISAEHHIPITSVNEVLLSAMEFRSVHALVEMQVNGPDPDEELGSEHRTQEVEIDIEILLGKDSEPAKSFNFRAELPPDCSLEFGPRLGGAFITVPCDVSLSGAQEFELTAPVEISAQSVVIAAKTFILRPSGAKNVQEEVIIEAHRLRSTAESVTTNGVPLHIAVRDMAGVTFPMIQYAHTSKQPPADQLLKQKFFRLRRILLEFRSHSRGSLARYKGKIESERVLRNEVGEAVLRKLIEDQVLLLRGNFYHLDPAGLNDHIGVTWPDLRKGESPESLLNYLRSIMV